MGCAPGMCLGPMSTAFLTKGAFSRAFVNCILRSLGLTETTGAVDWRTYKERQYDALAQGVQGRPWICPTFTAFWAFRPGKPEMIASFVFDLDSTVLQGSCCPPLGSRLWGPGAPGQDYGICDGSCPFAQSFPARVAQLRPVPVAQAAEIAQGLPRYETCAPSSRRNQERCYLATGNLDVWIAPWFGSWGWRGIAFPLLPGWSGGM